METTDENRIREIVRDELASFTPQKKKRAPNKWQIFLKDCAKEQDKELPYTDKVKLCSVKYKENKNKNPNYSPPEQPQQSIQHLQPPVQHTLPSQTEQPVQYVQPPTQDTQPTYHAQQMNVTPLTEEDADRLLRLTSEKLAKMTRRQ